MKEGRLSKWYDLRGRVVVLTGATGKLGQYYADLLAEQGANLALIDLDKDKVEELSKEINLKPVSYTHLTLPTILLV